MISVKKKEFRNREMKQGADAKGKNHLHPGYKNHTGMETGRSVRKAPERTCEQRGLRTASL